MSDIDYDRIKAIVVDAVTEALRGRRRRRMPPPVQPPPVPLRLGRLVEVLPGVPRHASHAGRSYVVLGEVLDALGIEPERHQRHVLAVAAELSRMGWTRGARLRPAGADGPRVVPYHPPQ